MDAHSILRRPVVTEKTTHGIETRNTYVFEIAPEANKLMVRKAIEEIFDVKVVKVNTRSRRGKMRRVGRSFGYSKDRKEAIVTLSPTDKLDIY